MALVTAMLPEDVNAHDDITGFTSVFCPRFGDGSKPIKLATLGYHPGG